MQKTKKRARKQKIDFRGKSVNKRFKAKLMKAKYSTIKYFNYTKYCGFSV